MSAEDNKQAAKNGYAAFSSGDAEGAMADISDSIEWVVSGDTPVSGTHRGKEEVGKLWGQLAEKNLTTEAVEFIAEGNKVAVVVNSSIAGEDASGVDILTYNDEGQLIKFEGHGGEEALARAFA